MVEDSCTTGEKNKTLANEIWASAFITQLCGVTVGLCGCIYLLKTRPDYSETTKFVLLFSPIGIAYIIWAVLLIIWLISSQINKSVHNPCRALIYIYSCFICIDILFLGGLVFVTGGPNGCGSIFLPIFLLIPAVTTCYCNPGKPWFWIAIASVAAMFGILVLAEYFGYINKFMDWISNANQMPSDVKKIPWLPTLLSSLVSIFCIGTAAFCYWLTDKVRRKPRSESGKDCHPDTCKQFYL